MKRHRLLVWSAGLAWVACSGQAQLVIDPLTSFGGGDGWLAPGEGGYTYLGTAENERGLAYGNGHLYLVSRAGGLNVRRLDPLTGADLGAPLDVTGISGGTFALNMISVAGDGVIYACNLANPVGPTASPFKVYRWSNDAATPSVAFSSTSITLGRMGDTFDAIGSGSSTRLVAGESSVSGSGARNGYAIFSTADGLSYTGSRVTFAGTPPNAGDFRLGLTFTDASHVFGTQGGSTRPLRYTSFAGAVGTLLGTGTLAAPSDRPMDFTVIGGVSLLATINTTDSTVRIWDVSDAVNPVLLGARNNTTGPLDTTGHGTGAVAWGPVTGDRASLWAMSANQGIQAFVVIIPEPGTAALMGIGLGIVLCRRRRR
jgi:hypothetical protein